MQNIYAWGYGEDMTNVSLDVGQLPSLRVQTVGHRWVLMFPLESVNTYLRSCRQGSRVSYKEILDFFHNLQPSQMAAYLSVCPDGVMQSLLYKGTVAYVPPGWILAEKAWGTLLGTCHVFYILFVVNCYPLSQFIFPFRSSTCAAHSASVCSFCLSSVDLTRTWK